MNAGYTAAQLAEGAIKRGEARLAQKYPFHTRVLEQFKVTAWPGAGTMGVTVRGGDLLLLHEPDFVLSLPADELGGMLLHEVLHVVLGHLALAPADFPDSWALTVAEEVTVNEFVGEPLPPGAVLLQDFPDLPPMESTRTRYDRLTRLTDRSQLGSSASTGGQCQAGGPGAPGTPAGAGPCSSLGTSDNHAVWSETFKDPPAAVQAIAVAVQQAALEAGMVPPELQAAVSALGASLGAGPGNVAGMVVQVLRGDRMGRLDWRCLLRRYTGQVLEPRPVFNRPPRRFPELLGMVPALRRLDARPVVVAVVDTSGSINDESLEQIDGELRRLNRTHIVHVVECDCAIQRVTRYCRRLTVVSGRGGTDFRPPLECAFLRKLCPNLIIVFTDGQGPAPEKPPPYPLIWSLVPGGKPPASYGRVIRMDLDKSP